MGSEQKDLASAYGLRPHKGTVSCPYMYFRWAGLNYQRSEQYDTKQNSRQVVCERGYGEGSEFQEEYRIETKSECKLISKLIF
jgi:hypothetical protein